MKRKLAAILVADMVGYSRLMQQDEAGLHAGLHALRYEILEPGVAAHQGRIFKSTGDGFLAAFASAVDAARCAVELQRAIRNRNDRPDIEQPILLRMGINLGEVTTGGRDRPGDSIAIAFGLEKLARAGAICVSDAVYQLVRNKFDCCFEDLGPQRFKSVAKPIHAYRLEETPRSVAIVRATEPIPNALPSKPSLAVLPFANVSGDPSQDYFAQGIAEDLITALSREHWFFVVARSSSFACAAKDASTARIARELGVRYLLEGSVSRTADRLQMTCQLIEGNSARHIWADRYDGGPQDVFALEDRIAESVAGAMAPRLRNAEIERARRKPPESLSAYDHLLHALPALHLISVESLQSAERHLKQAVAIDPAYGLAWALIAWCHTLQVSLCNVANVTKHQRAAIQTARVALRVDRESPETLAFAGYALALFDRNPHEGVALIDRSLSLNPNASQAWVSSGWARVYTGDAKTAIRHFQRGLRLSPLDPAAHRTTGGLAYAHMFLGDFVEAVAWSKRAIASNHNYLVAHRALAASLAHLGRLDEARATLARHEALIPGLTLDMALSDSVRHPPYVATINAGLQQAWHHA